MKVDSTLAEGPRAGAVPCPFCAHPIPVTAEALLTGSPLACQACGATLSVDRDRSAGALANPHDLQSQHDRSAAMASAQPTPTPRGRARRPRKRR